MLATKPPRSSRIMEQQQQQQQQQQQHQNSGWTESASAKNGQQHGVKDEHNATNYMYTNYHHGGALTGTEALHQAAAAIEQAALYMSTSAPAPPPVSETNGTSNSEANQNYKTSPSPETAAEDSSYAQGQPQQQHSPQDSTTRKRRICLFPGCTKVVKSQGHCQAHGAKTKRCSVEGCDKQAQTTHDGMCKRHWKLKNLPDGTPDSPTDEEPRLQSVYETILPQSIAFRPMAAAKAQEKNVAEQHMNGATTSDPLDPSPGKFQKVFLFCCLPGNPRSHFASFFPTQLLKVQSSCHL